MMPEIARRVYAQSASEKNGMTSAWRRHCQRMRKRKRRLGLSSEEGGVTSTEVSGFVPMCGRKKMTASRCPPQKRKKDQNGSVHEAVKVYAHNPDERMAFSESSDSGAEYQKKVADSELAVDDKEALKHHC